MPPAHCRYQSPCYYLQLAYHGYTNLCMMCISPVTELCTLSCTCPNKYYIFLHLLSYMHVPPNVYPPTSCKKYVFPSPCSSNLLVIPPFSCPELGLPHLVRPCFHLYIYTPSPFTFIGKNPSNIGGYTLILLARVQVVQEAIYTFVWHKLINIEFGFLQNIACKYLHSQGFIGYTHYYAAQYSVSRVKVASVCHIYV
jgi:hypothetical protein